MLYSAQSRSRSGDRPRNVGCQVRMRMSHGNMRMFYWHFSWLKEMRCSQTVTFLFFTCDGLVFLIVDESHFVGQANLRLYYAVLVSILKFIFPMSPRLLCSLTFNIHKA